MTDLPPERDLQKALDASELRAEGLQARLEGAQGILDAVSEAIYIQDSEGRFLDVNEGAVRMYGYPRECFIGKTPAFLSAPGRNDMDRVTRAIGLALQGEPQQFEYWGLRQNGDTFPKEVRVYPGTYQGQPVVIAMAQDITIRKRAEQTQEATYRIAEAALESRNIQELYRRVHVIVRSLMPAENLYFALWDRASDVVSFPYWVDTEDPCPEPRRLRNGLTEYVLRSGQALLVDEQAAMALEASGEVDSFGTRSLDWMGVPLRGEAGVFGAMVIKSYRGGHRYTPADRDLLAFVSGQVAMALERTRAEVQRRFLTTAMDLAIDPVFGMDATGRLVFVNKAACASLGFAREELLRLSVWDVDPRVQPVDWPLRWAKIQIQGANREETRHRRRDGTVFPVEISSGFLTQEGQEVVFTIARDITARTAAENALRSSEEKFSRAFHASPDAINITRLDDGTYLDVSEGFEQLTGWTRVEALGRTALDLNIWAALEDRQRIVDLVRTQGGYTGQEIRFCRKDGSLITGLMSGKLMEVDGVPCLLSITRDISDRKAAESALRSAEQRLRTVMANSQAVIYQFDPEACFMLSEGLGLAALGLEPGQVVGRSALELYQGDPEIVDQIHRALKGESTRRVSRVGGRIFDNTLTPVLDAQGQVESVIGIATDVTERQETEEALRAERGLFVGGPVMVIRWPAPPPWPVDYISPNVQALLGYAPEDLTSGRIQFGSLIHPEDRSRVHQDAELQRRMGHTHYEQQYRLRNAAGVYRWFHDFTTLAGQGTQTPYYLGYMLDITDRLQAEDALRQSQKLESLGILAGGIAHDFNNLLAVVLGNLNIAQMHLPEEAPAQTYLAKMEATVLRATELTKQMLAYSGRGHFIVKPHDLNEVVREVTHLLEVSISKRIRLRFDLEPDLPAIQADAGQLQQVVMNLVTNASDAIGDRDGSIHLATSTATFDERELRTVFHAEAPKAGRYVLLEVTDTGSGMSSEVMARIFDPFFTTKATGRGLGLSAMLGILKGHGAGLCITSEEGLGSSFRLCFPASEEPMVPPTPATEANSSQRLRGRILLVDDEDRILETIGSALQVLGLEVLTARDGLEALERFREARPDLVLMDLTMPRMDGREAFRAMHDLDPSIPVVLSSGYAAGDTIETPAGVGPAGFLQKPYQIRELRLLLERVLGG